MSLAIRNARKREYLQDDEEAYHEQGIKFSRIDDYERHINSQSISPPVNDSGLGTSLCSIPSPPILLIHQPHLSLSAFLPPPSEFCRVVGRLSLSGLPRKYGVTVEEIKRRVGPPECLNSSVLTGILRKAKLSGKSRSLRDEMAERGIDLKLGRKKQTTTTAFTALVEEESVTLAQDMDGVTQEHYPINHFAAHLQARAIATCQSPEEIEIYKRDLLGFMKIFSFVDIELQGFESPLCDLQPQPNENTELQQGFDNYSLLTHGFGSFNSRTWMRTFLQIACSTMNLMDPVTGQSNSFPAAQAPIQLTSPQLQQYTPQIAQLPPLPPLPQLCDPSQPSSSSSPSPFYLSPLAFPPPPQFHHGMYNLYQPSFLPPHLLPSADELIQSNCISSSSSNDFQPSMPAINDWSKVLTPLN
ncbi:unnamed protein product, partial [Mesorhabditis belari]|uniref:Transcription factor AP-2 C-terminal domain-containing protein n=1 Tax=Mesorhabditis belari TaxID=2138241 RepID=A0AAF3F275_9BILA